MGPPIWGPGVYGAPEYFVNSGVVDLHLAKNDAIYVNTFQE